MEATKLYILAEAANEPAVTLIQVLDSQLGNCENIVFGFKILCYRALGLKCEIMCLALALRKIL